MSNSTRWGMVTFCIGLTCGTLGHFLPVAGAAFGVVIISIFGSLIGKFSVEDEK
jgi:hypothetical protein